MVVHHYVCGWQYMHWKEQGVCLPAKCFQSHFNCKEIIMVPAENTVLDALPLL